MVQIHRRGVGTVLGPSTQVLSTQLGEDCRLYPPNWVKIVAKAVALRFVHSSSQNLERLYSNIIIAILSTQLGEACIQACSLEADTFL